VARNPTVLQSFYGTDFNVMPTGYANANLSNGGETIRLLTAAGAEIQNITYTDDPPWPTSEVDGGGYTLVIVDPWGDGSDPANWQVSGVLGGTPGTAEQQFTPGDFDQDGDVDGRDFLLWQRNPSVGNLSDWQNNYGSDELAAMSSQLLAVEEVELDSRLRGNDVEMGGNDAVDADHGSAIHGLALLLVEREDVNEAELVLADSYVEEVDRAFDDLNSIPRYGVREFGEMVARRGVAKPQAAEDPQLHRLSESKGLAFVVSGVGGN
jgi:hypothetical protein